MDRHHSRLHHLVGDWDSRLHHLRFHQTVEVVVVVVVAVGMIVEVVASQRPGVACVDLVELVELVALFQLVVAVDGTARDSKCHHRPNHQRGQIRDRYC